ncbi:MAG: hypothetical protein HC836_46410 [Richelia sp. RM2_1_2]|nr:hypothetical protein [Richelia sp. RM2_1_2]
MTKAKFDVSKIREEVDSRKKQQIQKAESSGQAVHAPVSSMSFLRSLKESVVTGNASSAVINKMKMVEQKAYEKNPIAPRPSKVLDENMSSLIGVGTNVAPQQRQQPPRQQAYDINEGQDSVDPREAQMYREMQARNTNLANRAGGNVDSLISEYYNTKPVSQSPQHQQIPMGGGLMLNERAINEAIDDRFTTYISESAGPIMEAALKNTIIELYSKERVKKALIEMDLTKMVKEIVIETIKELQDRNKKKQ